MKVWTSLLALAVSALCTAVSVETASAQATRTWVSGVGDDANPCSRTAPCKTFAGAISKTAAGGEINCLDQGAYGAVTITKSMTIACEGVEAGVLHSATNGVTINAAATDIVILRGLDIEGSPPSSPGLNGVRFLAGAALHIENCRIRDSNGAVPNGNGVLFAPSSGNPELYISDSFITGNGTASGGAGVQILPTAAAGAKVFIERTLLANNHIGVRASGNTTSGLIDVTVTDSTATGSIFHGFSALSGTGSTLMMLNRVTAANNTDNGLRSVGANSIIRVGSSVVSGNGTGVFTMTGGQILSYGNNQINGNTVDGANPPDIPLQ